jgi:RimJ/RimL family protein N-acetyltransferase
VSGKARFRDATTADVDAIIAIQEPAAVEGLGHIFPQDEYPFPRTEVAERWAAGIARPDTFVYVSTDDSEWIMGFAARRASELMHFGTALQTWGTGLATELHDHVVATFPRSLHVLHLFVFSENGRARRVYEKLGWVAILETRSTTFPPHPTLARYELHRDP